MSRLPGQLSKQLTIWGSFLLAACLMVPPDPNSAPFSSQKVADSCKAVSGTDGTATAKEVQNIAALRSSVESGPLYSIPAAVGVATCNARLEEGAMILEYRFRDGGRLTVKRDSRIEYTEQVAQVRLPRDKDPVAILADAERVAFGINGCGIDWGTADTQVAADDPGATQTFYYGDVCNCRAGFRRDAAGRVAELMLRSAC